MMTVRTQNKLPVLHKLLLNPEVATYYLEEIKLIHKVLSSLTDWLH
jgi:hypothetical protein